MENLEATKTNSLQSNENTAEEQTSSESTANLAETNPEKSNDFSNQLEIDNKNLTAENETLKQELALLKNDVKEEFKNDAITLAKCLVNENTSFEQAVKEVTEKYPQFKSTKPILNLGGSTPGISSNLKNDAFSSGLKNQFMGGK